MGWPKSSLTAIDAFRAKAQESGKPCTDFKTELFFTASAKPALSQSTSSTYTASKAPPRLVSDQMINIFFQEWAPLFPVLHRPTFLKIYTDYVANPEGLQDQQSIAQLNLVFGIAASSAEVCCWESSQEKTANRLSQVEQAKHGGFCKAMADCD